MLAALRDVKKSFGDVCIFEGVSFAVSAGERIGLIGVNGAGKTTLLNILVKNARPDGGEVIHKDGLAFGYLAQSSGLDSQNSILEEMRGVFSDVLYAQSEMRILEKKLESEPENATLKKQYEKALSLFEAKDGYNMDVNIKKILNGMGFSDKSLDMPISVMSGGEKTRLAIAKLLLIAPDLLILDEPTNHLDFKTLIWLENYLQSYKGAVVIVSHDRYFLDKTVTKILELEDTKVSEYKGNYSAYKMQKAERVEHQLKEYKKQSHKIAGMREYVEKNIARASTSTRAKSRLKQLEHIEVIEKPKTHVRTPRFKFETARKSGNEVLMVKGIDLKVGEEQRLIVQGISFELFRGQKAGVIGPNGTGKSTLIKSLVGIITQKGGEISWGTNADVGYYDQENKDMNSSNSVLDELWKRYPGMLEYDARKMLGRVLITGDEVYKKVASLSGGERAKLGFAILMAGKHNVLLLDEPTNHLDLAARESLEKALSEFEGTLLFVSHDRYFINALAGRIFELEDGKFLAYTGNFDEYMHIKESRSLAKEPIAETKDNAAPEKGKQANRREERQIEAKRRQRISVLEKEIEALEGEEAEINEYISKNPSDFEKINELYERLGEVKKLHDALADEWLSLT